MADQKCERAEAMCLWFSPHPSVFLASQKTEQVVFIQQSEKVESVEAKLASKAAKTPRRSRRRRNRKAA